MRPVTRQSRVTVRRRSLPRRAESSTGRHFLACLLPSLFLHKQAYARKRAALSHKSIRCSVRRKRRSCEERPPLASLYHHQNQRCLILHQRVDGRHRGFGVYVNYPMAGTQIPCFIAKYLVTFFLRHINLTRGTCSVRNSFGSSLHKELDSLSLSIYLSLTLSLSLSLSL
ncbi:unnamed protein product [Acanthosepion pharaonis]|uniref:Uncharacterized protein n=1 Tax=Acanthosepion pharaonis TaxID=158019 RepID=A0A812BJ60_ACAPH|nr:unnamed protein product [Sepia pharaonis]